jgi:hypothetical protein
MADDSKIADFSPEAIKLAAQAGSLESLVHDAALEFESDAWTAFVNSAIGLHRTGKIDLLASASSGEGPIDYLVERFYGEALPQLDTSVSAMLDVATALVPRSRDGAMPFFMYDAFSNWARKDAARVDDALAAIGAGTGPRALLIATLQAGLTSARVRYLPIVLSLLDSGSDQEVSAAGFVIGTVDAADDDERGLIEGALASAWASDQPTRRLAAFSAALEIGTREGREESIALTAVDSVEDYNSPQIRQATAKAMFLARRRLSEALVVRMCDLLRATEPGEAETIEAINHAIAQHLSGPTAGPRLALLADLLKRGVSDLETMDDCAHYILTNKDGLLTTLVTAWIADGSDRLIRAVHDLVMQPASDRAITLDLDFTPHALTAEQTLVAGRKVVPDLILFPVTAASILLSLMRTGHADAAEGLEELLFDPLLISYWEGPREYLNEAASNQPQVVQKRIARVIARLDEYISAIRDTGVIRELGPSERQRFLQEVFRIEERRAIEKSVGKRSVLADLFPTRVILYGDSVVSEVYRGDGKPERHEFPMGRIETSMPLARLDAIDPFGFWYQRIVLSMGKSP